MSTLRVNPVTINDEDGGNGEADSVMRSPCPLDDGRTSTVCSASNEERLCSDEDDRYSDVTVVETESVPRSLDRNERRRWTTIGRFAIDPAVWQRGHSTEQRMERLEREITRVQRTTFCHFLVMALVPTSLLLIIVVNAIQNRNDACSGIAPRCAYEARQFINAFTRRCVCGAVDAKGA